MTPDDATLELLIDDFVAYGYTDFASGTASNLAAASAAWDLAEVGIGTFILTGTATDEHVYRDYGWHEQPFQLRNHHLVDVPLVTVDHSLGKCACEIETLDGCVYVLNYRRSEVRVDGACANRSRCGGCGGGHAFRVEFTYTAGLFNTYDDIPRSVKTALAVLANWWNGLFAGDHTAGAAFITSWRSMDYNEALKNVESTVLGSSPEANLAWSLLKRYRVMRAVGIRSGGSIRI